MKKIPVCEDFVKIEIRHKLEKIAETSPHMINDSLIVMEYYEIDRQHYYPEPYEEELNPHRVGISWK